MSKLIDGLATAVPTNQTGIVITEDTTSFAVKAVDVINNTLGIPECDNMLFIPKLANNQTGVYDVYCKAFFSVRNGGNVYRRGQKGNNRLGNGRISMVNTSGPTNGAFGVSEKFNQVIGPLCLEDNKGRPLINLREVQGNGNIVELELDFQQVMCLVLGIVNNDPYDFTLLQLAPIGNMNNFTMMIMKYIAYNQSAYGRGSKFDYSRIAANEFRRYNGGNNKGNNSNNNSGRRY